MMSPKRSSKMSLPTFGVKDTTADKKLPNTSDDLSSIQRAYSPCGVRSFASPACKGTLIHRH